MSRSGKNLTLIGSIVVIGALWLASYFATIVLVLGGPELRLTAGGVSFGADPADRLFAVYLLEPRGLPYLSQGDREWREANELLGFSAAPEGSRLPLWFVAAAAWVVHRAAGLVLARLREWSHRRRARSHLVCRACGYDLRATPLRCPECGRVALLPSLPPAPRRPAAGDASGNAE